MATGSAVRDGSFNYFNLFDLPVRFKIDPAWLLERYRALHDAGLRTNGRETGGRDETLRERGLPEIDLAYQTLVDPITRAAYLVELLAPGGTRTDGSTGPIDLLVEQFELRESLDNAAYGPDPTTSVANILTELAEQGACLAKELERLLAKPTLENLGAARDTLRALQLLGACGRDAEVRRTTLASGPGG